MSPTPSSIEVEAKFRVHPPFELPELAGERTGAATAQRQPEQELRAVYWDTSDLRLAREGVTLRHRSGEGPDKDGWHLKLPVRDARVPDANIGSRDELHAKGSPDAPAEELRELVTPWVRTAVLGPVATLVTQRSTYLLCDADDHLLAEVTNDLVSVLSSGHVAGRFREIEVEDRGGGAETVRAVGEVLRAAGAVGGQFQPKVVRALGPQATAGPDPPLPAKVSPEAPVRCAVRDVLRRDVRALLGHDVGVRRDRPDAVHQMRVNARRIRSALKTFGPLLDRDWADALRTELKWLADSLGGARDNEVLLERLLADLDTIPDDLVLGPVRARIEREIGDTLAAGADAALETLRSERYVVLLERLVDAAWEPMTAPAAEEPAATAAPAAVRAVWDKLASAAKRLDDDQAFDADWHKVRVLSKQLRYSCESVEPMVGTPARKLAKQAEKLQEVLGEHQDAVVAGARLRAMASARGSGNVAFTLGLLHSRQSEAAASARARFRRAWDDASRPRHRRWLTT